LFKVAVLVHSDGLLDPQLVEVVGVHPQVRRDGLPARLLVDLEAELLANREVHIVRDAP